MATNPSEDDFKCTEDNAATVLEKVVAKAGCQLQNPSLLAKLADFLLDPSPDPIPITEESHPVFFHATKNDSMYHFVPNKGIGIHKDGTKLHCFDYEASFHNRSKDFYDTDIQAAINETPKNIHRLSNLLVAAFMDLVLDGNSDMTSYMYLMDMSTHALSDPVKEAIGDLSKDGGIALALVTELVATSSKADNLFKRAVLSREGMDDLDGLEGANESYVRQVYAAITPMVETKGVLLNNGIDISNGWGQELATAAPSMDKLVKMDFTSINRIVPGGGGTGNLEGLQAPTGDNLIAYQMYAGLIGSPSPNTTVPSIRGYALENDLSPQVAHQLEMLGQDDLAKAEDKDIYASAQTVLTNLTSSDDQGSDMTEEVKRKKKIERDNYMKGKMMNVRQDSKRDKAKGSGPRKRWKKAGGKVTKANRTIGKVAAKSALKGGVASAAGSAAGAGIAGAGAGVAGGLAAIAGPLSVALALAPIIKELAGDTDRQMNEDMNSAIAEREKIAAEVSDLLDSVKGATENTDQALADAQNKAQTLLDKVRNPGALALSQAQGMNLQKQLNALETDFGPTSMASLVPYTSDAELVAAVDSGRALSAVALFVDPDMAISTPQRQMLQTPKYVSMMGASKPFQTNTKRSTSEKETKSFVSSVSHSGFSAADKTVSTKNNSFGSGGNAITAGAKNKISNAKQTEGQETFVQTDDVERNEEKTKKGTQAFLTEFTSMPMKTFCLREGGLALSPYAFYRLQRIVDDKDANGEPITDDVLKEVHRRYKAREFIKDFGSHIPFGVQTLGGVFIRTMKITTETATSLSTLYATAASSLTNTNSEASKRTATDTARVGFLGVGASITSSTGHSTARSSGTTTEVSETDGNGIAVSSTKSNYESDVICFGPNAATQDALYQQLMSNNATWTIIDRGEPESYFAVWDLVDYVGQGGMLRDECMLLREVWEEMALVNSANIADDGKGTNALLDIVMKNYDVKQKMYTFVQALIYCLVPKNGNHFDADLAMNFKTVVEAGCRATSNGGIFDLSAFISEGAAAVDVEVKKVNEVTGQPTATDSQPSSFAPMFDLAPGNEGYNLATQILNATTYAEWANHFSYFTDTFTASIIDKGKPSYLYDVCRVCYNAADKGNWELVSKLTNPDLANTFLLNNYLHHKDETTGNHCLHLIIESNNLELVTKAHEACPSIASIENKAGKTPKVLVSDDKDKYSNLQGFLFPPRPTSIGEASIWAVDNSNNVHYLDRDLSQDLAQNGNKLWKIAGDAKIRYITISHNGKDIWGVDTYGNVHSFSKISMIWNAITCPKPIESIALSASGQHVWAIDRNGGVHKFTKIQGNWTSQNYGATKLKSISVQNDGAQIYGIGRENGSCLVTSGVDEVWAPYGQSKSGLEQVSVSPNGNLVWVTDWDGQVWNHFMGGWSLVDPVGEGKKIRSLSVDNGGKMWCTDQDNDHAWCRNFHGEWYDMGAQPGLEPSSFKQISACDTSVVAIDQSTPFRGNHIWLVGTDSKLYYMSYESAYQVEEVPLPQASSSITCITSNSEGHVWIVDDREKLFYRGCNSSTWQYLYLENVGEVAAGADGGLVWTSSSPVGKPPDDAVCDIDFAKPFHSQNNNFVLMEGARVLYNAPSGGGKALRIDDSHKQLAKLHGVNISPSVMPSCSLVIGVYVVSHNNNGGWLMGHEESDFDRNIVIQSSIFNGMGMSNPQLKKFYHTTTNPELNKWIHIVAVYHQNAPCHFYVDGVKAPISPTLTNDEGLPDVYIGGIANHSSKCRGVACWVKEAKVFNRGLDDVEVLKLSDDFNAEMNPSTASTFTSTSTFLNYRNAETEEIIRNHLEVDGIQSLAISDNEEFIGYCTSNGTLMWNKPSDSNLFTTAGNSVNSALSLTNDGKALGTHSGQIYMGFHSVESSNKSVKKIVATNDWARGPHAASMTKSGEHIWAIKADGKLYYKAHKDAATWEKFNQINVDVTMVSVS